MTHEIAYLKLQAANTFVPRLETILPSARYHLAPGKWMTGTLGAPPFLAHKPVP